MAQPENLEARVAALETQVRALNDRVRRSERDAAAARVLAGGADRDVGEIRAEIRDFRRATVSSFNAQREELNDRFAAMDHRFDQVIGEMRSKHDGTAAGMQQIVELLNTVIRQQGDGQRNPQADSAATRGPGARRE